MKKITLLISLFWFGSASAQDPSYTQPQFGWSLINPAYAGSLACARAEAGYRLQWPQLAASYQTFNAAYDQYFSFGGAGISYMHDDAGHVLKTDRVDFNYSYAFGIGMGDDYKNKIVVQPGIQFSYLRKSVDWNALNFGDQVDPRRGFVFNTNETPSVDARTMFDFSAGLLVYSKRISAGFATFHITEPDEGFFGESHLPMRFVMHASGIIGNADPDGTGLSIIPSVIFMRQGDFENMVEMVTVKYNSMSAGVGYRNRDALLFSAGYTWKDMTLAYSYDLTISKLAPTGGSHELHFSYRLFKDQWSDEKRNLQMFF